MDKMRNEKLRKELETFSLEEKRKAYKTPWLGTLQGMDRRIAYV
jgi:hypothetical protein